MFKKSSWLFNKKDKYKMEIKAVPFCLEIVKLWQFNSLHMKICFSMVLKVSTEQRISNALEYTKKKGTWEFK